MTMSWVTILACAALSVPAGVPANERSDADTLDELKAKIERVLPDGWLVELLPADSSWYSEHRRFRDDERAPVLLIRSKQPLEVRFHSPNPAAGSEPEVQSERVEIEFTAMPLVTPDEFSARLKANLAARAKRTAFSATLKPISWGFMGAEPIPPWAYKPKTAAEQRRVREYSLLWMRTAPQTLPTHYYGNLSFDRFAASDMEILDKAKARQYEQIQQSLDKVFKTYAAQ